MLESVAVAGLLAMAVAEGGQTAFREVQVAKIPVGPAADQISNRPCEGGEEPCVAGFAFLGIGDTLLFYDREHHDLKVLACSAPHGGLARIIPGPAGEWTTEKPQDGTRGSDGTLYLVSSPTPAGNRVRLTYLPAGGTRWLDAPPIDASPLGLEAGYSSRTRRTRPVRVASLPAGEVVVFAGGQLYGPSLVVASGGRLLEPAHRARRTAAVLLPAERTMARVGELLVVMNARRRRLFTLPEGDGFLGADQAAGTYFVSQPSWSERILKRYRPDGQVAASVALPDRPTWKPIAGKGDLLVAGNGDVLEVFVSERWLVVTRWIVQERE